ncbi:MAG: beta-galactosidase [Bifidobacteriaceae bacterium]|jgi:beta-galactosidase|nr:beta-galactosidase [Bifidobacteriaceae bacterium]
MKPQFAGVLFGAAYYAEYQPGRDINRDLDLMREAGFTVIRVGESVWSAWEPREGVFNVNWLAPVLDGAHARGISAILGTPTYAVPPWLQRKHPEIAAQSANGARIPWGSRQEVDHSAPAYRFHAERVIRAVVSRYAPHPAVIGFQLDNEPGVALLYNDHVFQRFIGWLKNRYGTVERLNDEWGLVFWSHQLSDWTELWRPEGNAIPQYDLAWRRFQAKLTTEFIAWQARIVDQYRRDDQFVTTCLQYSQPGISEQDLGEVLDVAAGNFYYGMQDHFDQRGRLPQPSHWTTTGTAGLLRQADRAFATKQSRFLITETNAQSIDGSHFNCPPYRGQLRQAAFALIARGAAMVEYWHWHTLRFGAETYWGGVLPHSLKPGRVYKEVAALGKQLATLGPLMDGYQPDADIAFLWSTPSRYALQFMPPLKADGGPDGQAYERIFDSFYRGAIEAGLQARIIHVGQAVGLGAAELARRFPVLVAAGTYCVTDAELDLMREYAELGGHLIVGPRTAYADEEARVRLAAQPAGLAQAAGAWYEEFSNLQTPVRIDASPNGPLRLGEQAAAQDWIECLIPNGAEVLAGYRHPHFASFAAVTSKEAGQGRITLVGTLPPLELARQLATWAVPESIKPPFGPVAAPITAASGTTSAGQRIWFVFNWGWDERQLSATAPLNEITSGDPYPVGSELRLGSWDAKALIEQ